MECKCLTNDEIYNLIGKKHNPPLIQTPREANAFQSEIRNLREQLVEKLSHFGEEAELYGDSDFAVGPDLAERPSVTPAPAPYKRQFYLTVLSQEFYFSDWLRTAHEFLNSRAPNYRLEVLQDFDPSWILRIVLTASTAYLYCTREEESSRVEALLTAL